MLGVDDVVETVVGGATWGLGFAAVAAITLIAGPRGRPLAKGAVRASLAAADRVREWTAEAAEQLQDLYAEAKYEHESQRQSMNGETLTPARRRSARTPEE
jgi:hypothetical protein